MIMGPRLRKFALAAHIALSVGWIGAVAGYVALDLAAATSQNAKTLRGCYLAMELIAWYVIVPLALAALLTGLVMSLGTTLVHSVGGMVVLLVILALNVYKPRGMTRYGWRKRQAKKPDLGYAEES